MWPTKSTKTFLSSKEDIRSLIPLVIQFILFTEKDPTISLLLTLNLFRELLFYCRSHLGYNVFLSFKLNLCHYSVKMYVSQLWCDFRKAYIQRLLTAYNVGCRAPQNLPWRASVSNHQVQCNIPTFETLLRKNVYLFLQRCRNSDGCALWCSQIVYIRPYSLNITTTYYFVMCARTLEC